MISLIGNNLVTRKTMYTLRKYLYSYKSLMAILQMGLISLFLLISQSCVTYKALHPPTMDYPSMLDNFNKTSPEGHFPLTLHKGFSLHPHIYQKRFLFYSSDKGGPMNIWMRDLNNTINVQIINNPASQTSPAVSPDGAYLVFVSEDSDSAGDIRIVSFRPSASKIIEQSLEGMIIDNLWINSVNLSTNIEELASTMSIECRGSFSERDPVWSPDGKTLYFSSDRCSPGIENIWKVQITDGTANGLLVRLTENGGIQPDIDQSGNTIVYLSYDKTGSSIRQLNPMTGDSKPVIHFSGGIVLNPVIDNSGFNVYYTHITDDTNHNNRLDTDDNAGIFRVLIDSEPQKPVRLLESGAPLYGLEYSDFNSGSIIYSAGLYESINIYTMPENGIIPPANSPEEQLILASRYSSTSPERYRLALKAVELFFGSTPVYKTLTGKIKALYARSFPPNASERKIIENEIIKAGKESPYTLIQYKINSKNYTSSDRIEMINGFLRNKNISSNNTQDRLFKATALYDLSLTYIDAGDNANALDSLTKLNNQFPEFPDYDNSLYLQGKLTLQKTGIVPGIYDKLLSKSNLDYSLREKILHSIVRYHQSGVSTRSESLLNKEKSNHHKLIKYTFQYIRAWNTFSSGNYEKALQEALRVASVAPPDSGIFLRAYKLAADISEINGDYDKSYQYRLAYGGNYRPETGVVITSNEYRDIIEDSERYIHSYLDSARSISNAVEEKTVPLLTTNSNLIGGTEEIILLNNADRDLLNGFCKIDSRAADLIFRTGQPGYVKDRNELCSFHGSYFAGDIHTGIPLTAARTAADLLYLTSYVNANLLNIMFLHIKKIGQFEDLYNERAVSYHRLKTDIAMERYRRKIAWDNIQIKLVNPDDLQNIFIENDPFDETTFNELVHGYNMASSEARKIGDYSILYGYAYTLIQKSVEREQFYDNLIKSGVPFNRSALVEKKEAILRDLKNAEYQLLSILYSNPQYTNAYLLLGWMYEYIDEKRSHQINIQPGYIDQFLDLVLRTNTVQPRDGIYFNDVYKIYFSDQLYEQNVELYRQALRILSSESIDPLNIATIHLNLANNHLKLMNFRRAIDNYRMVELKQSLSTETLFKDYRSEALYHFNYGRALFYDGQSMKATKELRKAYVLYNQNENREIQEEYSRAVFLNKLPAKSNGITLPFFRDRKQDDNNIQSRRKAIQYKLSLISSLIGLSMWDSGSYNDSVIAYRNADSLLYGEDGDQIREIERANLMNHLALAHQDRQDFYNSDQSAKKAEQLALDQGLTNFQRRFLPETTGGRLMGCVLNYGEDFSIIGDGRNPYGFSTVRQYELSLGIQLENMLSRGNMTEALRLLRKRREVFLGQDGDVILGKLGAVTSYNNEAFNFYRAGDFINSSELFLNAAKNASDSGDLSIYKANIQNYFKAIFSYIESHDADRDSRWEALDEAEEMLNDFQSEYRRVTKEQFISRKRTENADFNYDENIHDPIIEAIISRELSDLISIEALLHFYRGEILDRNANSADDIRNAVKFYSFSIELFNKSIATTPPDGALQTVKTLRNRINKSISLFRSGKLFSARYEILRIIDSSYEYNLTVEQWYSRYLYSLIESEIRSKYTRSEYGRDPGETLEEAIDILLSRPEIFYKSSRLAGLLFDRATDYFAQKGESNKALELLRKKWFFILQKEFMDYPLNPSDPVLNASLIQYRRLIKSLEENSLNESLARINHKDFQEILKNRSSLTDSLLTIRNKIISTRPQWSRFFYFPTGKFNQPASKSTNNTIRFFTYSNHLHVWITSPSGIRYKGETISDSLEKTMEIALSELFKNRAPSSHLLVIADNSTFPVRVERIIQNIWKTNTDITYITDESLEADGLIQTRKQSQEIPDSINVFNVNSISEWTQSQSDHTSDISLIIDENEYAGILSKIRNWPTDQRRASVAAIITKNENFSWYEAGLSFELLRSSGTGSLILGTDDSDSFIKKIQSVKGRKAYTSMGSHIFGYNGFQSKKIIPDLISLHHRSMKSAREYEINGNIELARMDYGLAMSYAKNHSEMEWLSIVSNSYLTLSSLSNPNLQNSINHVISNIEKLNAANKKEESYSIFLALLRKLYIQDQESSAIKITRRLNLLFPERTRITRSYKEYFKFLNLIFNFEKYLNKNNFRNLYRKHKNELLLDDEINNILTALSKRSMNEEIIEISHSLSNKEQRIYWTTHANIDQKLLGRTGDSKISNPGTSNRFIHALLLQQNRNFSTFNKLLSSEWDGNDLRAIEFQKKLLRLRENNLKGNYFSIQELSNVSINSKDSLYSNAPLIQRSVIFNLLIDSIPYDANLQVARYLNNLIEIEKTRSGPNRIRTMSSRAIIAYMNIGDLETASRFARIFIEQEGKGFSSYKRDNESRLASLILHKSGLLPVSTKSLENLRKSLITNNRSDLVYYLDMIPAQITGNNIPSFFDKLQLNRQSVFIIENNTDGSPLLWGLFALQRIASAADNYRMAFNISWKLHLYRQYLVSMNLNTNYVELNFIYRDYIQDLQNRLPVGQRIIGLVDNAENSHRILIKKNHVVFDKMKYPGRFLKGRIRELIARLQSNEDADRIYNELVESYRSLSGMERDEITYLILTGEHTLAPILPHRADRILFVFDIDSFLRNQDTKDISFTKPFHIRNYLNAGENIYPGLQIEKSKTLTNMELAALRNTKSLSDTDPVHIMNHIGEINYGFNAGIKKIINLLREDRSWFISSNASSLNKGKNATDVMSFINYIIGKNITKPGVMTMRRADDFLHPIFIKNYYSPKLPAVSTMRRFVYAYLKLRQYSESVRGLYGYRLVTGSPISSSQ